MKDIVRVEGISFEKIWGGSKIKDVLKIDSPYERIGEYWFVSGIQDLNSSVTDIEKRHYAQLEEHYKDNSRFYGNYPSDSFPLLIKMIDAAEDLSVQVHPSDAYALEHFNQNGKFEFWYVLDCLQDTSIAIGHDLENRNDLSLSIMNETLMNHINVIPIKPSDYFSIPTGTIHAIHKNTLIYEIQQSSDMTFRVYDYDRLDDCGNKRDLHIDDAIAVTNVPCQFRKKTSSPEQFDDLFICNMEENPYFSVSSITCNGKGEYPINGYFNIIGCIRGQGKVNGVAMEFGHHIIIGNHIKKLTIEGDLSLIRTTPL